MDGISRGQLAHQFFTGGAAVLVGIVYSFLSDGTAVGEDITSALGFGRSHDLSVPPSWVCTIFILLNAVRVWLGLTFLVSDTTFRAAVEHLRAEDPDAVRRKENQHLFIAVVLALVSVAFGPALRGQLEGFSGLLAVCVVQAGLIVWLDVTWWKALVSDDIERAANKIIILGDVIVLCFFLAMGVYYGLALAGGKPNLHIQNALYIFLFGALLSIFVGEWWSQYYSSIKTSLKKIFKGDAAEPPPEASV